MAGPGAEAAEHFTLGELVAEAKRELAIRRRAYPHWVRAGRLGEAEAARRIALMEAIVRRLDGAGA